MKYGKLEKLTSSIVRRLGEQPRPASLTQRNKNKKDLQQMMMEWRNTLEELRVADEELKLRNLEILATSGDIERERKRYQELFDLAPVGYVVTNWEGTILEANQAFSTMLDFSRRGLVRKPLAVYVTPEDRHTFRALLSRLKTTKAIETVEVSLRSQNKPAFPAQLTVAVGRESRRSAIMPRWLIRDMTERKRVEAVLLEGEAALHQSQEDLRALTAELMTAQEEERRRIARNLHDDTNQRMTLLMMEIERLLGLPSSGRAIHEPLQKVHASMVELSDHMRDLAHQLHPSILDDLGLVVAVRRFAEEYAKRTGIECDLSVRNMPETLTQDMASNLYRISQESLGNILKHARATRVSIKLSGSHGSVQLSIQDNGIGVDGTRPQNRKEGMGFISMRERARQMGGKFSMQSLPGQGTKITVKVPVA